jgi:anti-anti-sigma factor
MSTEHQAPQPSARERAAFTCEIRKEPGGPVRVSPVGDLDMASTPVLDGHLTDVLNDGTRSVVLDLSRLRFMDSTGLRLILGWAARCSDDGCEASLLPGPPAVQRVFEVTGMLQRLPFAEKPSGPLE